MKQIITFLVCTLILLFVGATSVRADNIAGVSGQLVNSSVKKDDIRVKKLTAFLAKHNSPLTDQAPVFVATADKYGMKDRWAMIAAIAGVESTFGKFIPKNSYNAWGWGIPTGARSGIGFDNWEDGIETVTKGLKEKYVDRGLTTPEKIMRVYAPPSHTWASNVKFFMAKIENQTIEPELSL